MKSRYYSKCPRCVRAIFIGDDIKQRETDKRWIHAECPKFDEKIGYGHVLIMNGNGDILYKKGKVPGIDK